MGDAALSSCLPREIKKYYPDAQIDAVSFGAAFLFLEGCQYISALYRLPIRTVLRKHQRIPELFLLAINLRKNNYDFVVDSSTINYPSWNLFLKTVRKNAKLITPFKKEIPDEYRNRAEALTLRAIGIERPDASLDLPSEPDADIAEYLRENNLSDFVLFNPFASKEARTISRENCIVLINFLRAKCLKTLVPYMPKHREFIKNLPPAESVYFKETKNIWELISLTQMSACVVTTETAAAHIASGYKKPTVAFYCHNNKHYLPDNPAAHVVFTGVKEDFDFQSFKAAFEKLPVLV